MSNKTESSAYKQKDYQLKYIHFGSYSRIVDETRRFHSEPQSAGSMSVMAIYQQLLPARFEQASNFNMGLPLSSLSTSAKIVGGVLLTFVGGWFAFIFVEYGAIGVCAAIRNHETWTYAGHVYWMLLLIGVLCAAGVVASWVILFAPKNPPQRDGGAKLP